MAAALAELRARLDLTEALIHEHRSARPRREIEAMACEIRAQAFREAIAIVEGRPLPPLRMYQSNGVRTAHRP